METKKILAADLLDLLFEDRNKEYGAYELRKTYNNRVTKALLITASVTVVALGSFFYANSKEANVKPQILVKDLELENFKPDEPVEPPPPTPPPVEIPPPVATIQFTTPRIVDDNDVKPEETPPPIEDVELSKIDVVTQKGTEDDGTAIPIDESRQVIVTKKVEAEDEIVLHVQVEASFEGGPEAWRRFLERKLNPNTPVDNGAPSGRYQVWVQFVVDKEGNISDVKPLTTLGYGMEEEAVKVIQKGPKWIPAIQNGNKVKAYRKQSILFVVETDE